MEIVIEYVLIDNLVINFLILYLTAFLLKLNYKKYRILLADIFGTALAIVMPIVNLNAILLIFLKSLVGIVMVLIAFKSDKLKQFLLQFFVFICSTALFGGITFFVYYLISGSLNLTASLSNSYNFPVGIICFGTFLLFALIRGIINYIILKQKSKKYIFQIEFVTKARKIKTFAYLDSGHNLSDPESKVPIIIINYSVFSKLYKVPIEELLLKKIPKELKNAHYIKISTLNMQTNEMLVFDVEEVRINAQNGKFCKKIASLGLSFTNFKKSFNCDALISPALV